MSSRELHAGHGLLSHDNHHQLHVFSINAEDRVAGRVSGRLRDTHAYSITIGAFMNVTPC